MGQYPKGCLSVKFIRKQYRRINVAFFRRNVVKSYTISKGQSSFLLLIAILSVCLTSHVFLRLRWDISGDSVRQTGIKNFRFASKNLTKLSSEQPKSNKNLVQFSKTRKYGYIYFNFIVYKCFGLTHTRTYAEEKFFPSIKNQKRQSAGGRAFLSALMYMLMELSATSVWKVHGPLRNTLHVYVKFIRKERHIKKGNESFLSLTAPVLVQGNPTGRQVCNVKIVSCQD